MKHHKYQETFKPDADLTDWDGIVIVVGCIALLTLSGVCMSWLG
jgi:hypothetical protein